MSVQLAALANLYALKCNGYPGRGLVMGLNEEGTDFIQVYWVMGRSENSRNRVLAADGKRVFTEPADASKVSDPSLIIYNAMNETQSGRCLCCVVSNGAQTDALVQGIGLGIHTATVLDGWKYEPDKPNYTPRITGVVGLSAVCSRMTISILRTAFTGEEIACERASYSYGVDGLPKGIGFCVTTYEHDAADGKPLPSFEGGPYVVPLAGGIEEIAQSFWDPEAGYFSNLVAIAVKRIDLDSFESEIFIRNKLVKAAVAA